MPRQPGKGPERARVLLALYFFLSFFASQLLRNLKYTTAAAAASTRSRATTIAGPSYPDRPAPGAGVTVPGPGVGATVG